MGEQHSAAPSRIGGMLLLLYFFVASVIAGMAFRMAASPTIDRLRPVPVVTLASAASLAPVVGVEPSPPTSAPPRAWISAISSPGGADVFRCDQPGVLLGTTPLDLEHGHVGERVELGFRLQGYRETRIAVTLSEHSRVSVTLTPVDLARPGLLAVDAGPRRKLARPRARRRGRRRSRRPAPATARQRPIGPGEVLDPFAARP
jgi:hypothetical protein